MELISKSPPSVQVGGDRWGPGDTQNPRHSRAQYFTDGLALEFVKKCLRELVAHRSKFGRGSPAGLRVRDETFMKDPSRRAYVLVVCGRKRFAPPVYVKWVLVSTEAGDQRVHFISFHQSDEIDSP